MSDVVTTLERLAFAIEVTGGAPFRARSFANAARALRGFQGDLGEALRDGRLAQVPGVGSSSLEVVGEVLAGRVPERLSTLGVPDGLYALRKVSGLGPGRIRTLWTGLGITSLAELEYACEENRLLELDGFGPALTEQVRASIRSLRAAEGWFRRDQLTALAELLIDALQSRGVPAWITGDLRRGCETAERLELVCVGDPSAVLPAGDAVMAGIPVRTWVCAAPDVGAVRAYTTGSAAYVEALGLSWDGGVRHEGRPIAAPDEDALFAALGLVAIPPERREAGAPRLRLGQSHPRLVRLEDLRGSLHAHTTASDGTATIAQMRDAAAARGMAWFAITDHSGTAFYAGGLDAERLLAHAAAIRAASGPCALLAGVESDILADGALDYPDEVLASLDVVVASIHARHRQGREALTARLVAAARHPYTDVIGHPTGRLLGGRPPADLDVAALLDACAQSGCAVECNASPHRLDLSAEHLALARERGVLVSIASDAHSVQALDNLRWGVDIARRAGLGPDDVLNTRPVDEVRAWVAARRARALAR